MRRAALFLILLVACANVRPPVREASLRTPEEWETVSDRRAWKLITSDSSFARYAADPEQLRPVRGPRRFVLPLKNAIVVIYPDRPATVAKLDPRKAIDPLTPRELEMAYGLAVLAMWEDLRGVPVPGTPPVHPPEERPR